MATLLATGLPAGQVPARASAPAASVSGELLSRDLCCSGLYSELSSQAASPLISANPDPSCPVPVSLILPPLVSSFALTASRCSIYSVYCESPPARVGTSWAASLVSFVLLEHCLAQNKC